LDSGHVRFWLTSPVDPPQALHHPLPGDQVTHHVIRVQIDADLAGRSREQKCRSVALDLLTGEEPGVLEPSFEVLALEYPARPNHQLGLNSWSCKFFVSLCQPFDRDPGVLCNFAFVATDENPRRNCPIIA